MAHLLTLTKFFPMHNTISIYYLCVHIDNGDINFQSVRRLYVSRLWEESRPVARRIHGKKNKSRCTLPRCWRGQPVGLCARKSPWRSLCTRVSETRARLRGFRLRFELPQGGCPRFTWLHVEVHAKYLQLFDNNIVIVKSVVAQLFFDTFLLRNST